MNPLCPWCQQPLKVEPLYPVPTPGHPSFVVWCQNKTCSSPVPYQGAFGDTIESAVGVLKKLKEEE